MSCDECRSERSGIDARAVADSMLDHAGQREQRDSRPIIAIQTAILYGFGNVLGGDRFGAAQIGDSARHLKDAVMRAGGEAHLPHGHL